MSKTRYEDVKFVYVSKKACIFFFFIDSSVYALITSLFLSVVSFMNNYIFKRTFKVMQILL